MLRRQFPGVRVESGDERRRDLGRPCVCIDLERWLDESIEVYAHDRIVRAPTQPFHLRVVHAAPLDPARGALEVATRYQGLLQVRNDASAVPLFDRVLGVHRELHDLAKPLVAADYHHGLDTWQWVLRLSPDAGLPVQIAALFHDVERLVTEPERRVEHHAADYASFKQAHADSGARFVENVLREEVPADVLRTVAELVAHHERPSAEPDVALLGDADALSFFSLNSAGFIDYYGVEHTRKKVEYTLRRLRPEQRWRLQWVRLRPEVRSMVDDVLSRDGMQERGKNDRSGDAVE